MTAFYYSFNMTWASISITQELITRIISTRSSCATKKREKQMESAVAIQERCKAKKFSLDRAFRYNYVYTTNAKLYKHCLFTII